MFGLNDGFEGEENDGFEVIMKKNEEKIYESFGLI